MRTYEALYIVRPDIAEDQIQTVADGVEKLITEDGGAIVRSEIWGKRRLAYDVNDFNEGIYILVRFESSPDFITKLERYYRLSDDIIRDLVVLFDAKTLRLEEEQERRTEALAAARLAAEARGISPDDDDDDDAPRPRREEAVEA